MATGVVWDGLDAYLAELAQFPETVTGEAARDIDRETASLAMEIKAAYPVRTGRLLDSVSVAPGGGPLRAAAVVQNTAPYAAAFERGTQARHTSIGANRGAMPPGRVLIPRAIKRRRALEQQHRDMLRRHGATQVTDGR